MMLGCALSPIPDTRTPTDYARAMDSKCRGFTEDQVAPMLTPTSVESVEAAYVYVMGGPNGRSARLRGARLRVRPPPGKTHETLTWALECHQANVVMGRTSPTANDPYVLEGRWLDIEVASEGDSFVALATTDDFNDAQEILARAKRFVDLKPK
jgi:hypothetical protein